MKTHILDKELQYEFEDRADSLSKENAEKRNLKMSLCGYLRKTTTDKTKVECKICNRILSNIDFNSTRL